MSYLLTINKYDLLNQLQRVYRSRNLHYSLPRRGDLIVSFPGKIAARVGENSRIVIGPSQNNRIEVNLKNGTVSALLDPNRDKENGLIFAIRTKSGVTEASGTFYAVTEYKGQAYAAVKKGQVKKETVPPSNLIFLPI